MTSGEIIQRKFPSPTPSKTLDVTTNVYWSPSRRGLCVGQHVNPQYNPLIYTQLRRVLLDYTSLSSLIAMRVFSGVPDDCKGTLSQPQGGLI